jgi:hypothetical protein
MPWSRNEPNGGSYAKRRSASNKSSRNHLKRYSLLISRQSEARRMSDLTDHQLDRRGCGLSPHPVGWRNTVSPSCATISS